MYLCVVEQILRHLESLANSGLLVYGYVASGVWVYMAQVSQGTCRLSTRMVYHMHLGTCIYKLSSQPAIIVVVKTALALPR